MRFDAALHISNSRQALSAGAVRRNSPPLTAGEINKLLAGQPIGKAPQIQAAGPGTIDQIPISSPLFVSSPSDELSWLTNVVPRSVSVRKPGYRRAGEAHITIGFHELPIDPILLKAMQVRIFFGTVSPDDAASGFTSLALDGSRRSVLRTYNAAGEPDLTKLAFWGIVDDMEVDWGTDSTITITARDLRSIFLDSPLTKGTLAKIKLDRPITDVIQQLVDAHPLAGKMQIKVQPSDWNGPIPSPCVKGNLTRENLGAKKGSKAKIDPASVLSKLKWWDAIIQWTYLVGAIPFFRGPDLFIRPAKSLYDLQAAGLSANNQTPFAGGRRRIDAGGNSFGIRKMIYGHNVKSLKFKRKYTGGERPRIVEVISVNVEAEARDQQLLTVYWPEDLANRLKRQHVTKESPSGQLSENEVWRISFHGIKDKAQLRKIAEAIFETTARYEVTGSFDTSELSSFVGRGDGGSTQLAGNADPDLLHLEPGDAVEFSVSPSNLGTRRAGEEPIVSELNRLAAMSFEEAVEYVDRRVRDKNIARAIVATYRQNIAETQSTYRINEVSYNWDGGKIRITGEFHNYIEVADGVYSNTAAANAQFSTISADQILKTKTVPASPTAGDAAIQQLSILDTEDI